MSTETVLVTGSSGTIGTRLCERLLAMGYDLVGVDRNPNTWNEAVAKVTIQLDLTRKHILHELAADVDLVVHLAANARVYNLVLNPELAMENLQMTFNVLEFCRERGVRRLMFASSREVYGNSGDTAHSEDEAYTRHCESPYTASKIGGEALVHTYHKCYGIDFVIMRFSNVYGMYDVTDRVVPLYIKRTLNNDDLLVYGRDKSLDFTYIDDAVAGMVSGIRLFGQVAPGVFNVSSGSSTAVFDVANMVRQVLDGSNKIVVRGNRKGEILRFVADISRARDRLAYEPRTAVVDGIRKAVEWYSTNVYSRKQPETVR